MPPDASFIAILSAIDDDKHTCALLLVEAMLQSLVLSSTENKAFALVSKPGAGPGSDTQKWDALFKSSL